MQKVVVFLEKHVQWLAIALGAVYLLWMVWSLVLNDPTTVKLADGTSVSPGKVDQHIYDDAATKLQGQMQHEVPVKIPVPELNDILVAFNQQPNSTALALNVPWCNAPTTPIVVPGPSAPGGEQRVPGPAAAPVAQLPKVKPAYALLTATGRSNVVVPPVNAAPLPGGAAGAAGMPGNELGMAPPAPAAPAGGGAVPLGPNGQPLNGIDLDWVTLSFKLPLADLASQFAACNIPQAFKTSYLDVELIRQEKNSGGDWVEEKAVPLLTIHQGSGRPPVPPANAGKNIIQGFLLWAIANPLEVLQPTFYTILKGDPWTVPGAEALIAAQQPVGPMQPFDPNQQLSPEQIKMLTPEQRNTYLRAQQKKKDDERRAKAGQNRQSRPSTPPRGGGTDMPGGPGGFAPNDPARPPGPTGRPGAGGPRMPTPYPRGGPDMGGESTDMPGMEGWQPQQPQQGALNPSFSQQFPLPPGEFDPRVIVAPANGQPGQPGTMNEVTAWAHDATVQPGKTYRYKVRYKIKNPIWNTLNVAAKKELAQSYYIVSDDSEWTADVKIPMLTTFFVSSINDHAGTARMDVFRWQDGTLHKTSLNVAPGDGIGKNVAGVDYNTGYTVVDVRSDSNEPFVLLIDPTGGITRRSQRTDANSPDLQKLNQQFAQTQTAAGMPSNMPGGAGGPGMGGAGPGRGGPGGG